MAFRDFWLSVRTGARFFSPRATVDSPKLDATAIEQGLRAATLWLTRRAVNGFDEADLDFLSEDDRTRISALVAKFREVASKFDPRSPATDDQVEQAVPLFRGIVEILEFDRYGDPEAFRLGKLIEREIEPFRPPAIEELRFNTGPDHSGDPAIWIWVFLTEAASGTDEEFLQNADQVKNLLDPIARQVVPDRWPYLSFRSPSDQADILADSLEAS